MRSVAATTNWRMEWVGFSSLGFDFMFRYIITEYLYLVLKFNNVLAQHRHCWTAARSAEARGS